MSAPGKITVDLRWWSLMSEPARLEQAAGRWRTLGQALDGRATALETAARTVLDEEWKGAARDSYEDHQRKLRTTLSGLKAAADAAAGVLTDMAALLRDKQFELSCALESILLAVPFTSAPTAMVFAPETPEQSRLVGDGVAVAQQIRTSLDTGLERLRRRLFVEAEQPFKSAFEEWKKQADGAPSFQSPPESSVKGDVLRLPDGSIVINSGGYVDDKVKVTTNDKGEVVVDVNGHKTTYPPCTPLTIRTGAGDDVVDVDTGASPITVLGGDGAEKVTAKGGPHTVLTGGGDDKVNGGSYVGTGSGNDEIQAGDGDDVIAGGTGNDEIYGGKGADSIDGGSGDDYVDGQDGDDVLHGGDDADIVYGLDGVDRIFGGAGADYLEGGKDDDLAAGGSGADIVSGGRGADTLLGGHDPDVIYGGRDRDTVDGGTSDDRVYVQAEDVTAGPPAERHDVEIVDSEIAVIEGSEEFADRVQADLDLFGASPTGRQMLENLEQRMEESRGDDLIDDRRLIIKEFDESNGRASNLGGDATLSINPEYRGSSGRPSVVLYHELAHAYDYLNGTGEGGSHTDPANPDVDPKTGDPVPKDERQAVGLPIDPTMNGTEPDPDKGRYVIDPEHPIQFTENGLRQEFGLGPRSHYGAAAPEVKSEPAGR
ncbi:M91 family zinc metallopeptidase [Phytomonospora sp. NPDC050363]|uniref:M91 family zinc metallopeptidase n=1 Tax=Phytomonospora sp. NPDC050363 TaxID=3155642 RepID=UPI00340596C0